MTPQPIIIDKKSGEVLEAGEVLPLGMSRDEYIAPHGTVAVWPVRKDGSDGRWRIGLETAKEDVRLGYIKSNKTGGRTTISYLAAGVVESIKKGEIIVTGKGKNAKFESVERHKIIPGTAWQIASHDASKNGTAIVKSILGTRSFSFPKSLYAVRDALKFFVDDKPDALILDFFAGSGTTMHAVNLLNAEDGGRRRCILVTNNEVSDKEATELTKNGYKPGDDEWEQLGIARYVTWPRTVCSIKGHDITGTQLKGNYLDSNRLMADGFSANAVFFKLSFLDKTSVALGRQFKELLPVLWMKGGAIGECPVIDKNLSIPNMLILPQNKIGILIDEKYYSDFDKSLSALPEIKTVFIVTDSEQAYRAMIAGYGDRNCYQLYRDYLDNFRINVGR